MVRVQWVNPSMPGVDSSELRAWELWLHTGCSQAGLGKDTASTWDRQCSNSNVFPLTEFSSITESLTQYVNKMVLQERKLDCSGKQQHVKYLEGQNRFEVQKIKGKIATVPPGASARA